MAQCSECGKSIEFGTICDDCKARLEEKQKHFVIARRVKIAGQQGQAIQNQETKMKNSALGISEDIKRRLQTGQKVYLYETVYLPVDSVLQDRQLNDSFTIPKLRRLGLDGWEVIQVIPRTIGIGLTNHAVGYSGGESWGGGIGGNITGVHVILKKELINNDDLTQLSTLDTYILNHIEEF